MSNKWFIDKQGLLPMRQNTKKWYSIKNNKRNKIYFKKKKNVELLTFRIYLKSIVWENIQCGFFCRSVKIALWGRYSFKFMFRNRTLFKVMHQNMRIFVSTKVFQVKYMSYLIFIWLFPDVFQWLMVLQVFHSVIHARWGSSRPGVFYKIGVLKNFAKFTRKHLCFMLPSSAKTYS